MKERRKYPRLDATRINFLCKKISKENVKTNEKTKNLSEDGICLNLGAEPVQEGDILQLEFMLPNRNMIISCKGKVVWAESFDIFGRDRKKEYEAGVEFFDIGASDKKAIRDFVFSVMPDKNSL